jgi:hypothetical protein
MRHLRSRNNTVLLSLLSLMMTLNASQAMVWCVGHDGHVAVEPLAHIHHDQTDDGDSHCCPCTDIPIPVGVCTARPALTAPETKPAGWAIPMLPPAFSTTGPAWITAFASPVEPVWSALQRSIILQV